MPCMRCNTAAWRCHAMHGRAVSGDSAHAAARTASSAVSVRRESRQRPSLKSATADGAVAVCACAGAGGQQAVRKLEPRATRLLQHGLPAGSTMPATTARTTRVQLPHKLSHDATTLLCCLFPCCRLPLLLPAASRRRCPQLTCNEVAQLAVLVCAALVVVQRRLRQVQASLLVGARAAVNQRPDEPAGSSEAAARQEACMACSRAPGEGPTVACTTAAGTTAAWQQRHGACSSSDAIHASPNCDCALLRARCGRQQLARPACELAWLWRLPAPRASQR